MILRFPDATTINAALMGNAFLAEPRFQQMGIIERIKTLAAEQFANKQVEAMAVGPMTVKIIHTIKDERKDLHGFVSSQLSSIVTETLERCAERSS